MRRISRLLCSLVLVVGASACGGSDGGTAPPPPPCPANTFCMTGGLFYTTPTSVPTSLTVAVNTPVAWLNNSAQVFHNVTFANPFAARAVGTGLSGNIAEHASGTNSRQFNATGTYSFECTLHFGMIGTVVVQ